MAQKKLAQDGLWTRANTLFKPNLKQADIALIGIPVHRLSLTANSCHLAPKAIRAALARYSTYSGSADMDLRDLKIQILAISLVRIHSQEKRLLEKKLLAF